MPTRERVLPLPLVKRAITKIFNKWNPNLDDADLIDWDILDNECCFNENLDNIKQRHPEYVWEDVVGKSLFEEQLRLEKERHEAEEIDKLGEEHLEDEHEIYAEQHGLEYHRSTKPEIEQTVIISKKILVKPHSTTSKGKKRLYGRIQLTVDKSWIGKTTEIRVIFKKT